MLILEGSDLIVSVKENGLEKLPGGGREKGENAYDTAFRECVIEEKAMSEELYRLAVSSADNILVIRKYHNNTGLLSRITVVPVYGKVVYSEIVPEDQVESIVFVKRIKTHDLKWTKIEDLVEYHRDLANAAMGFVLGYTTQQLRLGCHMECSVCDDEGCGFRRCD